MVCPLPPEFKRCGGIPQNSGGGQTADFRANRVQPANSKGGNWWQSPLWQVQSGAARALAEESRQLTAQLGRLLWAERQAEHRQGVRQVRQAELEKAPTATPEPSGPSGTSSRAR